MNNYCWSILSADVGATVTRRTRYAQAKALGTQLKQYFERTLHALRYCRARVRSVFIRRGILLMCTKNDTIH